MTEEITKSQLAAKLHAGACIKHLLAYWFIALLLACPPDVACLTIETVYSFNISTNQGHSPEGGLIQGSDGRLYGTTKGGRSVIPDVYGSVFACTLDGDLTTLHYFTGTDGNGAYGTDVKGSLVQGADGALYGTTDAGGLYHHGCVYRITTNGVYTTLHSFNYDPGKIPWGNLVQASDGYLYGTTAYADAAYGSVFRMSLAGVLETVHLFNSRYGVLGNGPWCGLIQAADGFFYGTTRDGGDIPRKGTVYRVSSGGEHVRLHSFSGDTSGGDGGFPVAPLTQGSDGYFYGTAKVGGNHGNGVIFKMAADGSITNIHHFYEYTTGSGVSSPLMQGADGHYYGTADWGGEYGGGTLFRITSNGVFTLLHSFKGAEGRNPIFSGLVEASNGMIYGTTFNGGSYGHGNIYRFSPNTYRLSITSGGCGSVTGATNGWYAGGTLLTLDAHPDPHYHLAGWAGTDVPNISTARTFTVTMDHDIYVTAQFAPNLITNGPPGTATPEWWLFEHFGVTNYAVVNTNDTDGDGYAVWEEYIADTNPTNAAIFFPPLLLDPLPTGLVLTIDPTSTNRRYHIDSRPNLLGTGWTPVTNSAGTGGPWIYEIPLTGDGPRFYRSRVTLP